MNISSTNDKLELLNVHYIEIRVEVKHDSPDDDRQGMDSKPQLAHLCM